MLTSTKAAEYATDWANERQHNTGGKLDELDLSQGWLAGYYAARHGGAEAELEIANAQLEVARKALKDIGTWNKNLQADVEEHHSGIAMWRGCIAEAKKAIQDMRNIKRK